MAIKYAILNPNAGTYEFVEDTANIQAKMNELAMAFYLTHTHNTPVSIVDTDEAGGETWSAFDLNTLS